MYLSRIYLDISRKETREAIENREKMHGAIEKACGNDSTRNLWRIDIVPSGGNFDTMLLLLSESLPDLTVIQSQFGYGVRPGQTTDYTKLLNHIEEGDYWRFRLNAVPVKSIRTDKGRGKKVCLINREEKTQWFMRAAEKIGAEVSAEDVAIWASAPVEFKKAGRNDSTRKSVCFYETMFEGILKIKDAELFRNALKSGIGREKAYGAGMLTVMPV